MRPVNLIPDDLRRGPAKSRRGGALAYVVIGALVVLLGGMTLMVVTSNQISSNKSEIAQLEGETAASEAKASSLAAYTDLRDVSQSRVATVTSLADSRFDWERVLRELSLVLPTGTWLTNLTGTVNPAVVVNGASSIAIRTTVPGPALQLTGCARTQDDVARFVSALKDIDGITRVGVQSSEIEHKGGGEEGGTDSAGTNSSECPSDLDFAEFEIVAAFDEAPTASTGAVE